MMKVFSLLSAAAMTLCLTASGFCDEENPQEVDARISQGEKPMIEATISHSMNGNSGSSYRNNNSSSYSGMSGSSSQMDDGKTVCDSVHGCTSGFAIQAEFIWWRAQIDNLSYAINYGVDITSSPSVLTGHLKDPDFEFDPGVRVSVGYDFGRDNWDVFLRWTYQNTSVTNSTGSMAIPDGIDPVKVNDPLLALIRSADTGKAKWQNKLNVLDFEMGYDYFLSRQCSLRPFMGIKAAWIDMHYQLDYNNFILNDSNFRISTKSDYWGVGPQVGMEGNLHIGWGFSIYGLTSAALVYGTYDSRFREADTGGDSMTIKHDNFTRQRAIAQIAIGVEWAWCFSGDYLLAFNLGWESQYWWNQYEMIYADDTTFRGDLTYTGLDAGIRFDF